MEPSVLVEKIKQAIDDRKGKDIEVMDVKDSTVVTDYMVVCSGTSTTHLRGIADEVILKMEQEGVKAARVEGYGTSTWILIDFLDVVVHIFLQSEREFYNLEKLWKAGGLYTRKKDSAEKESK